MTRRYAEGTEVGPARTREAIERELARYGASAFGYMQDGSRAMIVFEAGGRRIRMELPVPGLAELAAEEVNRGARGFERRGEADARRLQPQRERERWRALLLIVKAKLEAVRSGIRTLEQEFLADIVLPEGQTVGEWLAPQLELTYERGEMPPLLPGPGGKVGHG